MVGFHRGRNLKTALYQGNGGRQDQIIHHRIVNGRDGALVCHRATAENSVERIEILAVEIAYQNKGVGFPNDIVNVLQRRGHILLIEVRHIEVQDYAVHIDLCFDQSADTLAVGHTGSSQVKNLRLSNDRVLGQEAVAVVSALKRLIAAEVVVIAHLLTQKFHGILIEVPFSLVEHFLQADDVRTGGNQILCQLRIVIAIEHTALTDVIRQNFQLLRRLGNGTFRHLQHITAGSSEGVGQVRACEHGNGLDVHFILAGTDHKTPDGVIDRLCKVAFQVDGFTDGFGLDTNQAVVADCKGHFRPLAVL